MRSTSLASEAWLVKHSLEWKYRGFESHSRGANFSLKKLLVWVIAPVVLFCCLAISLGEWEEST